MEGELSEEFSVQQGLRQGCPLSPCLFNIFLDLVVWDVMKEFQGGVALDNCLVHILLFADVHRSGGKDRRRPVHKHQRTA